MGILSWIGRQASKLRRTRSLPAAASEKQKARALHAPSSNQQSPHSYGRKVKRKEI